MKRFYNLSSCLMNFRKDIIEFHKKDTELNNILAMWKSFLNITIIPNGKAISPMITRFRNYKEKSQKKVVFNSRYYGNEDRKER